MFSTNHLNFVARLALIMGSIIQETDNVIVGGSSNTIEDDASFSGIVGGSTNDMFGVYSFIGGGTTNTCTGTACAITGGDNNNILNNVSDGFIGGGSTNTISTPDFATIGGGNGNTISGTGWGTTIPGGIGLQAVSNAQTVIGLFNDPQGTSTHSSTVTGDRLFIVGMGTDDTHRKNAFEVSNNGHSIVYHTNGTGAVSANIVGATYVDNTLNAWAHWKWTSTGVGTGSGTVISDHGVTSIVRVGGGAIGRYTVTLNITTPSGTSITMPTDLCVTVTACNDGTEEGGFICGTPVVVLANPVTNVFEIDMTVASGCSFRDHSFMMHVTGRYP